MSGENIKVCVALEYHTAIKKIKSLTLASVEGPGAGERPRHKSHTVDSMTGSVQGRDPQTGSWFQEGWVGGVSHF